MNQNKLNESNTRAIHALLGKSSHRTNRQPVVAVVVAAGEVARTEAKVPRPEPTVRIRRTGPVEAVRAGAVD